MLTIAGRTRSGFCDGVTRRDFLRIGGLALGGLSLPQLLQAEARAGVSRSHKAVIMVFLAGGPPHLDMFDMKPDAPSGIRGEYKPIPNECARARHLRVHAPPGADDGPVHPDSFARGSRR